MMDLKANYWLSATCSGVTFSIGNIGQINISMNSYYCWSPDLMISDLRKSINQISNYFTGFTAAITYLSLSIYSPFRIPYSKTYSLHYTVTLSLKSILTCRLQPLCFMSLMFSLFRYGRWLFVIRSVSVIFCFCGPEPFSILEQYYELI